MLLSPKLPPQSLKIILKRTPHIKTLIEPGMANLAIPGIGAETVASLRLMAQLPISLLMFARGACIDTTA